MHLHFNSLKACAQDSSFVELELLDVTFLLSIYTFNSQEVEVDV